jgi:transposase
VDTYHRGRRRRKESTLGKQRRYTEEFKTEAVQLARTSKQSIRRTALDLGVSNQPIGVWMREGHEPPGNGLLSADERAELTELRRRVKVLETEREILRKAAAFFAQETERTR